MHLTASPSTNFKELFTADTSRRLFWMGVCGNVAISVFSSTTAFLSFKIGIVMTGRLVHFCIFCMLDAIGADSSCKNLFLLINSNKKALHFINSSSASDLFFLSFPFHQFLKLPCKCLHTAGKE